MITITDGNSVLTVTSGAYNTMYAPYGWRITGTETNAESEICAVTENKEITPLAAENAEIPPKVDAYEDDTDDSGAAEEVDLSEIPLSKLTSSQLKQYAKQLGVEVNTDSARQLRAQIKKVLGG